MNNFWKRWNANYCKHINTDNVNISGYQKPKDIANAFREYYTETFIKSAENTQKVSQFNKMRLNYVGDTDTDTLVTIENI